jgi:hypothetical protein
MTTAFPAVIDHSAQVAALLVQAQFAVRGAERAQGDHSTHQLTPALVFGALAP